MELPNTNTDSCINSGGPSYDIKFGKTLLENWVEERQCADIDKEPRSIKSLHVNGHRGILTKEFGAAVANSSTSKDAYREPSKSNVRQKGARLEGLEKKLYELVSVEVDKEFNPPPPKVDYTSTTKKDFSRDFTPLDHEVTMTHDVNSDQAFTFWNQNMNQVHGVSQVQTKDTPFKKNAAFSTPIDEYKDAPKPGENWGY